ncbi:MAG: hypothetical protein Q8R08_01960 [bacterium]|nr:hypothetical protein [bacterium]
MGKQTSKGESRFSPQESLRWVICYQSAPGLTKRQRQELAVQRSNFDGPGDVIGLPMSYFEQFPKPK